MTPQYFPLTNLIYIDSNQIINDEQHVTEWLAANKLGLC